MTAMRFEQSAIDRYPTVAAWQAEASSIVATMLERWHLRAGTPYVGGVAGSVLDVLGPDGSTAVLKVGFPHEDAIWEAVGLESMGPTMSPRLLEQDSWTWAMLLERVVPGTPLSRSNLAPSEALRVGAELVASVHDTAIPIGLPTLASAMNSYSRGARVRLDGQRQQLEREGVLDLVVTGLDLLDRLASQKVEPRFLHGDFNPGNLLDGRHGWRVVDPKPLAGDPAFDLWPLVSQLGHPGESQNLEALLTRQLAIAADAAGIDAERAAEWAFARSALDVSWNVEDNDPRGVAIASRQVRAWATVAG